MTTVTLTIDGAEIVAESGLTILEVARRSDIAIPTLCHVDGKSSSDPCGICVVEVEGHEGLVHSCRTQAEGGMAVITSSEQIMAHRQETAVNLQNLQQKTRLSKS